MEAAHNLLYSACSSTAWSLVAGLQVGPEGIGVKVTKVCPECEHRFQGNGWDGIDAHWRSKHEAIMPYKEAWPSIRDGEYVRQPQTQSRVTE